jgi:hypothetical protein
MIPGNSDASNAAAGLVRLAEKTQQTLSLRYFGCGSAAPWLPIWLAALGVAAVPLLALDPDKPPGGNFDLSHWKLTLPDANASEIPPAQLMAGSVNQFFHTGADGAMVFWCPVTGGTTRGSSYPRSELRELLDPGDDNVNWTGYGRHSLRAQCKVTRIPSSKKVIIGQIHGFGDGVYPLIKLQFNNGAVEALVKQSPNSGNDTRFTFATVGLNDLITYRIKLVDGLLTMRVNGTTHSVNVFETDPAWTNHSFYFKAGNYCQDNSGATNEGAVVSFYELSVAHGSAATTPPVITNSTVNASGHFMFTVLGPDDADQTVQVSTDLSNWSNLLTTNPPSGWFEFTDTAVRDQGRRLYRTLAF